MAIVITRPTVGVASTSNTSSYAGPVISSPTANSLLIAIVSATGTVATGSMTGGSLTWVKVASYNYNSGVDTIYLFYAKVGASPVSTTPTFDCTGDAGTGANISVMMLTGYDNVTSNPIKQVTPILTGGASPGTVNARILFSAAVDTNNAYIGGWAGQLAAGASTPPTGWTEADDIAYTTPAGNLGTAYRSTGETALERDFTNAQTAWGAIGVEVYTSGAGPVNLTKQLGLLGVG